MAPYPMHPWHIYVDQLFHHGYGYPLWKPNPDDPQWEVELGDVGWVANGAFKHVLRTRNAQGSPQPFGAAPLDYTPFNPPNLIIEGPREAIVQPVLYGRTLTNVHLSMKSSSTSSPTHAAGSPEGNLTFSCSENRAALLAVSPIGLSTSIETRRHVVTHLRENVTKWENFANEILGLDLKSEDLLFVCGVTKTRSWTVAAFHGIQPGAEGSISCSLGASPVFEGVTFPKAPLPTAWFKTGPSYTSSRFTYPKQQLLITYSDAPEAPGAEGPSPTEVALPSTEEMMLQPPPDMQEEADQCVFFHYYKMKRRFLLPSKIEAGAGPHQLPPNPGHMDTNPGVLAGERGAPMEDQDIETAPKYSASFDPVNFVLDYIIQNSEAEVAIASDLDLYALFKDQEFPQDIPAALSELQPSVEIDESGVGMLSVNTAHKQKQEPEQDCEEFFMKERAANGGAETVLWTNDTGSTEADIPSGTSPASSAVRDDDVGDDCESKQLNYLIVSIR
ncbi:hypothetical protein C8Q78DRAFT_1024064 [Trametes maxima]|nr:hypothetical protein C8Q78DRAFT_1024064 [Trametes maxima]